MAQFPYNPILNYTYNFMTVCVMSDSMNVVEDIIKYRFITEICPDNIFFLTSYKTFLFYFVWM